MQLIADYLVEDFKAMQRASTALHRLEAVETVEIAAPEPIVGPDHAASGSENDDVSMRVNPQ